MHGLMFAMLAGGAQNPKYLNSMTFCFCIDFLAIPSLHHRE